MRKFLLFLISIFALSLSGEDSFRNQFLVAYYSGGYERAHEILKKAFSDSTLLQIWEERVHAQKKIEGCPYRKTGTKESRAVALLRIGKIKEARREFGDDWLSLLGLATVCLWENDLAGSRENIRRALVQNPEHPELLFFAGNIAASNSESRDYFRRFLARQTEDALKIASAKQAIDFLEKVDGISLDVASLTPGVGRIPSRYEDGRLTIRGKLEEKEHLTLLFDTGAAGLALEERDWHPKISSDLLMIGLGGKQLTGGQRAVFGLFSAGEFSLRNAVAAISPELQGHSIDGIAGAIIFSDYSVLVPLRRGRDILLFQQSERDPLSGMDESYDRFSDRITFSFYLVNKMIILKGRIRNSEDDMDMLLDTGAARSVLSTATARKYAPIDPRRSRLTSGSLIGLGGRVRGLLTARNVEIQLGPLRKNFNEMPALNFFEISDAMELELDLILGQDFLAGYTLLIDYRNRTVTFLR